MKSVSCLVGRHDWTTTVEAGESVTSCRACGAAPRGSGSGRAEADDLLSGKTTGQSNKSMSKGY